MTLPRDLSYYFTKTSLSDFGYASQSFDMGMSTAYVLGTYANELSAQQKVEAIRQRVGRFIEATQDGRLILYHGTDQRNASTIRKRGAKGGLFLAASSSSDNYGAGYYGDHILRFAVAPDNLIIIEDTGDFVLNTNERIKPME